MDGWGDPEKDRFRPMPEIAADEYEDSVAIAS